jgi:hypothetical protein
MWTVTYEYSYWEMSSAAFFTSHYRNCKEEEARPFSSTAIQYGLQGGLAPPTVKTTAAHAACRLGCVEPCSIARPRNDDWYMAHFIAGQLLRDILLGSSIWISSQPLPWSPSQMACRQPGPR